MPTSKNTRLCLLLSVILSLSLLSAAWAVQKKFVAVTQITSHTALDAARQGVKEIVFSYARDNEIELIWVFENAQGNIATAVQISKKFSGLNPDVIVAISTPSAQAAIGSTRDSKIPVVFCAVTDPISARLIGNMEKPGGRVTGTYDFPPIGDQLDLALALLPDTKRIGILYNPGEINSVSQLEVFRREAKKRGLKVLESPAFKSVEVIAATQKILQNVDLLYIPQDNTIISSLSAVVMLANERRVPVIAPDPEGVKLGALATVGYSHKDEGRACGEVVVRILKGENPGDISVELPKTKEIYMNLNALSLLGINVPLAIMEEALLYE